MKYFIQLDEENRIVGMNDTSEGLPNSFEFEFPDNFDISDVNNYLVKDGILEYSRDKVTIRYLIEDLEHQLKETDYISSKITDKLISGTGSNIFQIFAEYKEKYSHILEQRQQWRDEINKLKEELGTK